MVRHAHRDAGWPLGGGELDKGRQGERGHLRRSAVPRPIWARPGPAHAANGGHASSAAAVGRHSSLPPPTPSTHMDQLSDAGVTSAQGAAWQLGPRQMRPGQAGPGSRSFPPTMAGTPPKNMK
jgi:hypothetical protein